MRSSGVAKRRRIKGPNGLKENEICDRLDRKAVVGRRKEGGRVNEVTFWLVKLIFSSGKLLASTGLTYCFLHHESFYSRSRWQRAKAGRRLGVILEGQIWMPSTICHC